MQRVGLIGLGNVGSGFAEKLRHAGYPLTVLDKDEARMEPALALGAKGARTPGEVAAASDIVLLSLPDSPAVEAVMDGPEGVLESLGKGQLVVDTGTSRPETDIRYAGLCAEKGAGFMDAPITGRSEGWIIMAGGTEEEFEKARTVLECLAYKLRHIGPVGKGQALKLTNQLVQAGQWAVWAEAIEFARSVGRTARAALQGPGLHPRSGARDRGERSGDGAGARDLQGGEDRGQAGLVSGGSHRLLAEAQPAGHGIVGRGRRRRSWAGWRSTPDRRRRAGSVYSMISMGLPSGSRKKAQRMPWTSCGGMWNSYPRALRRACSFSTLSTLRAMCVYPTSPLSSSAGSPPPNSSMIEPSCASWTR